jgi:septum formation protein
VKIVLASASASRAQILRSAGVPFEVQPADIDEDAIKARMLSNGASVELIALELAEQKACEISRIRPNDLIIGGDQVLCFENQLVSKCTTLVEARDLLLRLRGHRHALVGGLVLARSRMVVWRHTSRAELTMRAFSDVFLADYLVREGQAALSSVGCYRLEGLGAQMFDSVHGDHFAILGLDLVPLLGALRAEGAMAT